MSGEFWVKPNGLDLPRRNGLYVRYRYWKVANMIRPLNGIQSDFSFIYSTSESIAFDRNRCVSRVKCDTVCDQLTFSALFLSGVTELIPQGDQVTQCKTNTRFGDCCIIVCVHVLLNILDFQFFDIVLIFKSRPFM